MHYRPRLRTISLHRLTKTHLCHLSLQIFYIQLVRISKRLHVLRWLLYREHTFAHLRPLSVWLMSLRVNTSLVWILYLIHQYLFSTWFVTESWNLQLILPDRHVVVIGQCGLVEARLFNWMLAIGVQTGRWRCQFAFHGKSLLEKWVSWACIN